MGPILLKEKSEIFQKKWIDELQQMESIVEQINRADSTTETEDKKRDVDKKIAMVKEALVMKQVNGHEIIQLFEEFSPKNICD